MTEYHPLPSDRRFQDLTGKVFGRLTVLGYAGRKPTKRVNNYLHYWRCECECGITVNIMSQSLNNGRTKSCGCLKTELQKTHGKSKTSTYQIWANMLDRCNNPKCKAYPGYGGRNVSVCERWHEFSAFLSDMGERPHGRSIDRINNNGNYEPGNCRWATKLEQDNNRRTCRYVTRDGETMTVAEWSRKLGLPYTTAKRLLIQ